MDPSEGILTPEGESCELRGDPDEIDEITPTNSPSCSPPPESPPRAEPSLAETPRAETLCAELPRAVLSRAELSRSEPSRVELSRAEPPSAEPPRPEPPRAEPPRAGPPHADPPHAEPPRAELSRAVLSRAVLSRPELSRPELSRPELSRPELSRPELSRPELSSAEPPSAELSCPEPTRAEPTRAELSRAEPTRAELSRAELSRAELSRVEPSRAEPPRAEPLRARPPRNQPSLGEPPRAEPSLAEPPRAEPLLAGPSRAQPSLAEPPRAEPTPAQRPVGKNSSLCKTNILPATKSNTTDRQGPKTSAKGGTITGPTGKNPASKGGTGIKEKKPIKAIEVASKIDGPVAEPNREPRAALSAQTDNLATVVREPAPMAVGSDKKTAADKFKSLRRAKSTIGLSRGKAVSLGNISCQDSLGCSSSITTNTSVLTGEYSNYRSARELLNDTNKMKVFDGQLLKLETIQSEFLRRLEALKDSMPEKVNHEFKLIGVLQDGSCKLAVQDDYLNKIPFKLPAHVITDLKKDIQDVLNGYLITVQEEIKNKEGLDIAQLEDRLEKEQASRLSSLFDKMNNLCLAPDTSDQDMAKCKKQLLDAKEQREVLSADIIARENSLIKEYEGQIAMKDDEITDLKRKIKTLQKGQEKLLKTVQSTTNEQTIEQEERGRLSEEINCLKDTQLLLTKKLQQNEATHKRTVRDLKEREEEIAQLQSELEERKQIFEDNHSRTQAEISLQLDEKTKEVVQLRAIIKKFKREYAALEEDLNETRKEMDEIEDSVVEVEDYKEQIRKLEEELEEKERELEERPQDPEQYPAAVSSLLRSNNKLKGQIDQLNASLNLYKQNCVKLLGELKHKYEMDAMRREMLKTIRENEAEQGERTSEANSRNLPQQIKCEPNRSDELLALCSRIGSKAVGVARREHLIQLLQENNDRKDLLRVKQQEEIGRLREEVYALKQAMQPRNRGGVQM